MVKTEHEKFLLSLESPMRIPREKITRWHPEFDIETCSAIPLAELPQAPNVEKAHSAKDVLGKFFVILILLSYFLLTKYLLLQFG